MKMDIVESPFNAATRTRVCSHLNPIVVLLEENGCKFDWITGVIPDKAAGNILLSKSSIDFDLIEKFFNIPNYINLDATRNLIFCRKCWCAIEKKQSDKVFNSSVKPN